MQKRNKEIINGVIEILTEKINPSKIFLFGSRAKGNNDTRADFDFAVDYFKPPVSLHRTINEAIDKFSGLYKIDIVYLESVDKEFKAIILKTGKVIYEK